jgi:hypothetical protein
MRGGAAASTERELEKMRHFHTNEALQLPGGCRAEAGFQSSPWKGLSLPCNLKWALETQDHENITMSRE